MLLQFHFKASLATNDLQRSRATNTSTSFHFPASQRRRTFIPGRQSMFVAHLPRRMYEIKLRQTDLPPLN